MKKIKLKEVIEKEFNKSFRYRTKSEIVKTGNPSDLFQTTTETASKIWTISCINMILSNQFLI